MTTMVSIAIGLMGGIVYHILSNVLRIEDRVMAWINKGTGR